MIIGARQLGWLHRWWFRESEVRAKETGGWPGRTVISKGPDGGRQAWHTTKRRYLQEYAGHGMRRCRGRDGAAQQLHCCSPAGLELTRIENIDGRRVLLSKLCWGKEGAKGGGEGERWEHALGPYRK